MFIDPQVLKNVRRSPYPAINFSNRSGPIDGLGNFLNDDLAIGRMGAEHLIDRGYRHFAAVSLGSGIVYGDERLRGFGQRVNAEGMSCTSLFCGWLEKSKAVSPARCVLEMGEMLKPHLEKLPLDTGIFAVSDWVAGLVQRALIDHFPDRLHTTGVLGVDNEQQIWWYLGPLAGLSSVVPPFNRMGREAIEWLIEHPGDKTATSALMRRFAPEGVVDRASTAGGACADPMTARMVRWAWSQLQLGHPVLVSDLASHHNMSRRSVDRRFNEYLGQPCGEFLGDMKLDLARHLLKTTELPIVEISQRCGFAKQDVLSRALRLKDGCTPSQYRADNRRLDFEA
jgi:LacI family transcriptional regulator